MYSDIRKTGEIQTSDPVLNQLISNIFWGQRGNFLDVPTDCPQRDERLGWTGDAQVFTKTASYNFDVERFFTKWLHDLAADQMENGAVGHVVPDYLVGGNASAAGRCGDDLSVADLSDVRQSADLKRSVCQYEKMVDYVTNHTTTHICGQVENTSVTGSVWMRRREAIRDQAEKILLRLHFMHIRQNL